MTETPVHERWLFLTPESEAVLPPAVAALAAALGEQGRDERDERAALERIVLHGDYGDWLAYLRERRMLLERYVERHGPDALAVYVGDGLPWMTGAERADAERLAVVAGRLARTVDPADPWSHPDADRLDRLSVNAWLREQGAMPAVIRARELAHLGVAAGSAERTSLLSVLRMDAVAGGLGVYDLEAWESLTVAEGSATVALRMASELGDRLRL